jgi:hypothetical protein
VGVLSRAALRRPVLPAAVLAVGLAGPLLVLPAAPAAAHAADPRVVTVVDAVEPPLPAGVVVQVQAGIASQVVVANPTATELSVLGRDGQPFLRVSRAGVLADLDGREFYETSNPVGSGSAAPARVQGRDLPPRFVPIGRASSWGWYDHRLHPSQLAAPADTTRPARLGEFVIPLRYGSTEVAVRGHVEFRPLRGTFEVTADLAPEELSGVTVQVLQSNRLPGLFLTNTTRRSFTILGRDGEPFARFGPRGLEVNEASRTRVEDQQARGATTATPSTTPQFALLGGASLSWLDPRLRYPSEAPPEDALRRDEPTTVGRWEVPVEVEGRRTALRGEIRWIPSGASTARPEEQRVGLLVVGGLLAAGVLAAGVLLVRRAARARAA